MNGNELANGEVVKILKDFDKIDFPYIGLVIGLSWVLIESIDRVLPWLAGRLPARFRFYILPLVPVLRLLIVAAGVIIVVPELVQPKPENLIAILGAFGLAIGFAFKDYVSSLAAGVVAIYEHPYRPGDWVRIDGAYGEVVSVEARALRILTLDDTLVTIPHKKMWDTNVYNANNARRELMCIADFYLHPKHDAALVRQKLYEVAVTSPYLQLDKPITVIVAEKPWATHYRLKAYPVEGRDQLLFTTDLTIRGKAALAELGIEPALIPPAMRIEREKDR
ncbi:MAG: mechanosensitive ion channel family protein [Acidobacteriota bacterium]